MFAVLGVVRRLHEMLVLLDQAAALAPSAALTRLRERVSAATEGTPVEVLDVELDRLAALVGDALRGSARTCAAPDRRTPAPTSWARTCAPPTWPAPTCAARC